MIDREGGRSAAVYADFDQADLDREYSPSSCVPDLGRLLDDYAVAGARARATLRARLDLRYGTGPRQLLDFFPAAAVDAPLQVFVHGGYWQQLDKRDGSFPALDLVPAGVAFAAVGYGLAPEHRLDEIVASVRQSLWWLLEHAAELGFDPTRVHLAGSSAGAQLVAMALCADAMPDGRPPATVFAGATLLSGVYDLEPIRLSYVNEALGLDSAAAARNSPLRLLPDRLPPLIVARGGNETSEFARQHDAMVRAARDRGGEVQDLVVAHRNHFDLPFDLGDPGTALGRAVLARLGSAGAEDEQRPV
ncbi:arylformamidase [Actinoalloteichus hoggarensis]|uniref:Carboxylesterase NlhH n=1 Tax=Actinoalloteichus hoggarensis TaxID=1470176 RepID=A0A221WAB4_9PSEU|nr:alpha/beta hydrolase [Actinoalloteichus hoggarensis]ASO22469.1 Carboxylesterase NlhH [Actinoalloteichus hoggarensis]MBB5923107.1 arylformamidase [Actinoalloteichus hoggarensis]